MPEIQPVMDMARYRALGRAQTEAVAAWVTSMGFRNAIHIEPVEDNRYRIKAWNVDNWAGGELGVIQYVATRESSPPWLAADWTDA